LRPRFRVLSDDEVRIKSFGIVQNAAWTRPPTWAEQRHSLFDPVIFGPEKDFCCICGKCKGEACEDWICDICGVKVGKARLLRRRRFGHICLGRQIPHPWFGTVMIRTIPVLPIGYRCDRGQSDLDYLYSRVILASRCSEEMLGPRCPVGGDPLVSAVQQLLENESTDNPVLFDKRLIRSLSYYCFEDPARSFDDLAVYLTAMMLRVECG